MVHSESDAETQILNSFCMAIKEENIDKFTTAFEQVESYHLWARAFRKIKGISASIPIRYTFMEIFLEGGDSLRGKVDNDRVLVAGLRVLLPPYAGPSITIYRGAGNEEEQGRRRGHSWTTDLVVARSHAAKPYHGCRGIVLEADAPPDAIISAPCLHSKFFHESEYVVDKCRLKWVRIKERVSGPLQKVVKPTLNSKVVQVGRYTTLRPSYS